MTRLGVILAVFVLAVGCGARAAGSVGSMFELGVSARVLGLGGATAAVDDGPAAALLNPASLGQVEGLGLASLYARLFGGANYGAISFSAPCLGLAAAFVDSGWIASGDAGFRFASQGLVGAAAVPVGPVSGGVRWRFLRVGSPFEGHGWAVDAGLLVDFAVVQVGAIWEAMASRPMTYEGGTEETWASDLRLGATASVAPLEGVTCTAVADVVGILDAPLRVHGGVELDLGSVAGRVGWDGTGPTLGLSVRVAGVELDWSFAGRSDLGASHRVSLAILFSRVETR